MTVMSDRLSQAPAGCYPDGHMIDRKPEGLEQWSRFFEQNFYVDKWSLCRD